MGKFLTILLTLSGVFTACHVYADCSSIQCFDQCSGSYVSVNGDTCSQSFDPSKGCYRADGYCSSSPGGPSGCGSIQCFDQCSGSYVSVNGNTCSQSFDPSGGCYRADGTCN